MSARALMVFCVSLGACLGAANAASAYTINTTETGKRIRWGADTVALRLQPGFEDMLEGDSARASMEMALDAWRGLPRVPELVLPADAPATKPGHRGGAPSNGVYLLERWPHEPDKLAITVITYEMETGRLLDADILVNGRIAFALLDERSRDADAKHYDLAAVLTHEVGHVLGLGESRDAEDATMWPYAAPGETLKRTLAEDDEEGVIASYLSAPPQPAGGCAPLTIAGRARMQPWSATVALLLAGMALRGRRRSRRARLTLWVGSGALLLAGFTTPPTAARTTQRERLDHLTETRSAQARALLASAAQDSEPELRMYAAETLARAGAREDRDLAERLSSDADPRIAARAHKMLALLAARPPREVVDADTDAGRARLQAFRGDARALVHGRAQRLGAQVDEGGLIFTEYAVSAEDGTQVGLRVLGGHVGGVAQRALDGELPPAGDQELVVATQTDGTQRWAFAAGGLVFGGYLGDGPAIAGRL